ncbi:MAG: antitoxin MazE5 [Solirubrobacteraceae bacterium]
MDDGTAPSLADSELTDAALSTRASRHHRVAHRAVYTSYDEQSIESLGEWGDLASFRAARAAAEPRSALAA